MSMSRQDFVVIANTLKDNNASEDLCYALAYELRTLNDRFDLDRFMLACGHGGAK
jgi:hypothetical protein